MSNRMACELASGAITMRMSLLLFMLAFCCAFLLGCDSYGEDDEVDSQTECTGDCSRGENGEDERDDDDRDDRGDGY